jgi:hypothetical protein
MYNILNLRHFPSSTTNISKRFKSTWSDLHRQRQFFDELASKLNIKKLDDWNNVKVQTVLDSGAWFVKRYHGGSLLKGNEITAIRHQLLQCYH